MGYYCLCGCNTWLSALLAGLIVMYTVARQLYAGIADGPDGEGAGAGAGCRWYTGLLCGLTPSWMETVSCDALQDG